MISSCGIPIPRPVFCPQRCRLIYYPMVESHFTSLSSICRRYIWYILMLSSARHGDGLKGKHSHLPVCLKWRWILHQMGYSSLIISMNNLFNIVFIQGVLLVVEEKGLVHIRIRLDSRVCWWRNSLMTKEDSMYSPTCFLSSRLIHSPEYQDNRLFNSWACIWQGSHFLPPVPAHRRRHTI